jgi:hypothetical protein
MIQNIVKGRGFRGALDYALGKDGAERIGGTMAGRTPRELAAEFRALRELRPTWSARCSTCRSRRRRASA